MSYGHSNRQKLRKAVLKRRRGKKKKKTGKEREKEKASFAFWEQPFLYSGHISCSEAKESLLL